VPVVRLRHVAGIFAGAVILVFVVDPWAISGPFPLIGRLEPKDRVELYKQVSTVTATLLGFLITAVAILVSLDLRRQIVEELHRGEAFSLLVVNLLAAVVFLFAATGLGIAAAILDAVETAPTCWKRSGRRSFSRASPSSASVSFSSPL